MEMEHPELLTVLKTEFIGLMGAKHYATDPDGNVWICTEMNGKSSEWQLYKTVEEVNTQQPSLSFEQIVKLNSEG